MNKAFLLTTYSGANISIASLLMDINFHITMFILTSSILIGLLYFNINSKQKMSVKSIIIYSIMIFIFSVSLTLYFEINIFITIITSLVMSSQPLLIDKILVKLGIKIENKIDNLTDSKKGATK